MENVRKGPQVLYFEASPGGPAVTFSPGEWKDGKRIKLGFNTDELGIVTSVTDGEAAQASNLLEGDIIGGLSSEGRVNFVNKKSAKVHF